MPATRTNGVKKTINKSKTGKRGAVPQQTLISGNRDERKEKIILNVLEKNYEKKSNPHVCHQRSD